MLHLAVKKTTNRYHFGRVPMLLIASLVLSAGLLGWATVSQSASTDSAVRFNRNVRVAPSKLKKEITGAGMNYVMSVPLATITVDRTDDVAGASACTSADNDCSLRGAVAFANINPGTTISLPAGTYNLSISGVGEGFSGNNAVGDLDISGNNTSIVGAGAASTTIHQTTANDRVIELNPNLDAGFNTSISDVTISGGNETTGVGGGGIISGSIDNSLTLTNCTVTGNSATGAGTFGGGGVLHTGGSLTVTGCTFSNNSTSASGGAIGYSAGDPIGRTPSSGTFSVTGSTFSSNSAASAAAGGGALDLFNFNLGSGMYAIASSTFSNNTATNGSGGAIIVESGPLMATTTAFTSNHAGNSGGAITSAGSTDIRYSRLVGNSAGVPANGAAIFRSGGTLTADDNWWGSNSGAGANVAGTTSPAVYLVLSITADPTTVCPNATSSLTADIKSRNAGSPLTTELNGLPTFDASYMATLGTVSGDTDFVNGASTATFTAGGINGSANIDVTADNETVGTTVEISGEPPTLVVTDALLKLWPPNHQYNTFSVANLVVSAAEGCTGADVSSSVVITSVSSDEPENGDGDGSTVNDIVIAPDCKSVQLRAERNEGGNGRVYRINLKVTTSSGSTTATVYVYVPVDHGGAAVDDGPSAGYTVNSTCP